MIKKNIWMGLADSTIKRMFGWTLSWYLSRRHMMKGNQQDSILISPIVDFTLYWASFWQFEIICNICIHDWRTARALDEMVFQASSCCRMGKVNCNISEANWKRCKSLIYCNTQILFGKDGKNVAFCTQKNTILRSTRKWYIVKLMECWKVCWQQYSFFWN